MIRGPVPGRVTGGQGEARRPSISNAEELFCNTSEVSCPHSSVQVKAFHASVAWIPFKNK